MHQQCLPQAPCREAPPDGPSDWIKDSEVEAQNSAELKAISQFWLFKPIVLIQRSLKMIINGDGSIPVNTIFMGWTSICQLFWCELQGYKVLTHCQITEWRTEIEFQETKEVFTARQPTFDTWCSKQSHCGPVEDWRSCHRSSELLSLHLGRLC